MGEKLIVLGLFRIIKEKICTKAERSKYPILIYILTDTTVRKIEKENTFPLQNLFL